MEEGAPSPLSPYRALDLTDAKGFLCGCILAGLGADVIKVERPGGDPSRNTAPFYQDVPHPERSLYWFAYNGGKRGITLNLESPQGRDIFKRLVETSDFVIESYPPGYLEGLGLGYSSLARTKPGLIMTSISAYGQSGPYRDFKTSDLVAMAMGGLMHCIGDPDRPPVRISAPQAFLHAGAHAAAGTLIAHYHSQETGEGQQVDVSVQEAVLRTLLGEPVHWEFAGEVVHRAGPKVRRGAVIQREIWPCKDGFVGLRIPSGRMAERGIKPLVEWIKEEGVAGELAKVEDWRGLELTALSQEVNDGWEDAIYRFFLTRTKAELHREGAKRRIILLVGNTPGELRGQPQLAAREFWVRVEHSELGTALDYPGAPFRLSETPWRVARRAPLIGEHNQEVYARELGFSRDKISQLQEDHII